MAAVSFHGGLAGARLKSRPRRGASARVKGSGIALLRSRHRSTIFIGTGRFAWPPTAGTLRLVPFYRTVARAERFPDRSRRHSLAIAPFESARLPLLVMTSTRVGRAALAAIDRLGAIPLELSRRFAVRVMSTPANAFDTGQSLLAVCGMDREGRRIEPRHLRFGQELDPRDREALVDPIDVDLRNGLDLRACSPPWSEAATRPW